MKKIPAVVLIFLIFAFISACNESPTNSVQPIQFDSARYNWEKIDIPYTIRQMCMKDTNDIYFIEYGDKNLITFKNRQFSIHSFTEPDFLGACITNHNNDIYIAGVNPTNTRPIIQKWNGSSMENIVIPSESSYQITQAYSMSNGEVWFSGTQSNMLRISGSNIYHYFIDPDLNILSINYLNGEIYCVGTKMNSTGTNTTEQIYKLQSGVWTLIKEEVYPIINPMYYYYPILNPIENHMYSLKDGSDIYDFDGMNFNRVLSLDSVVISRIMAGPGINDFTFRGYRENEFSIDMGVIYNWNGSKMSIELKFYQTGTIFNVLYKNSPVVLSSTTKAGYANTLFIGKR